MRLSARNRSAIDRPLAGEEPDPGEARSVESTTISFGNLKTDPGKANLDSLLVATNAKLKCIDEISLISEPLHDVPAKFIEQFRQRCATESIGELRRHPAAIRYSMVAMFCWRRQQQLTDALIDLLLQVIHNLGTRAEKRIDTRQFAACQEGQWIAGAWVETGEVREQRICLEALQATWRRMELTLDESTDAGDVVIRLWSNLPDEVSAAQIAQLYRKRWHIEGMFQRLESVLHSEIRSLGHPRSALAVLAYNVLAVLKRGVEQAHDAADGESVAPPLDVSTYYLAQDTVDT